MSKELELPKDLTKGHFEGNLKGMPESVPVTFYNEETHGRNRDKSAAAKGPTRKVKLGESTETIHPVEHPGEELLRRFDQIFEEIDSNFGPVSERTVKEVEDIETQLDLLRMNLERELRRHNIAGGAEVDLDDALLGLSEKDPQGPDAKADASGKKTEKLSARRSLESDSSTSTTENTTSSSGSSGSSSSDEESEDLGEGSGADDSNKESKEEFIPGVSRVNEQQLIARRKYLQDKQKRLSKQLTLLTERMLGGSIQRDWKEACRDTLLAWAKDVAKGKVTTGGKYSIAFYHACVRELMKKYYEPDAAEREVKYLLVCLRKPNQCTLRAFLRRLLELNRMVKILPSAKDEEENRDDPDVRRAQPLDHIQVCQVVMDVMPQAVKDAYRANRGDYKIEKDPVTLANKLTLLEKMHSKDKAQPREVSGPIPKKKQKTGGAQPKVCERCTKWGGKPNGHTAAQCRRWLPDGKKNPQFGQTQPSQNGNDRRRGRQHKRGDHGGEASSRRELEKRIQVLEKALKDDE